MGNSKQRKSLSIRATKVQPVLKELILPSILYCIVLFSLYLGFSGSGEATSNEPFLELSQILQVMDKHNVELTDWTLYTREHLNSWQTSGEYENELALIQEKTTDFQWQPLTTDEHSGQIRAMATYTHHDLGVTETLTYIIYPHKEQLHSYLIYNIQGTKNFTEKQWNYFSQQIKDRLEDLFIDNSKFFTCATGIGNDKLNFGLLEQAEMLVAEFSAQTIEFLKEETFISISAYTNTWNSTVLTKNQDMNLQVAIRANGLGGQTTITIGTPIITTEY